MCLSAFGYEINILNCCSNIQWYLKITNGGRQTTWFDFHNIVANVRHWSGVFVRCSRMRENLRAIDKPLESDKRVSPSSVHGNEWWWRSSRLAVLPRVVCT